MITLDTELQKRKDELIWALRTRILTVEEMQEVEKLGPYLMVRFNESFRQDDIEKRFNDLLLQQFKMRIALEAAAKS